MKIKLFKGIAGSETSIAGLESFIGRPISESVKSFLRSFDGAKPETNIFPVSEVNDSGITRFIPLCSIPEERRKVRDIARAAYPIAWAEGGNYVVIDEDKAGSVYFWDHELVKPFTKVADDFDTFLNSIQPFDISSIEFKPGQVKKAWIDPSFLSRLKKTRS